MFFEFHPHHCLVKSQVTKEVLLQGKLGVDGLYRFEGLHLSLDEKSSSTSKTDVTAVSRLNVASTNDICGFCNFANKPAVLNTSSVVDSSSFSLWHNRLGHPSPVIVKKTLDSLMCLMLINQFLNSALLAVWERCTDCILPSLIRFITVL